MTLWEIKEQYAKNKGLSGWVKFCKYADLSDMEYALDSIAKSYAQSQVEKATSKYTVIDLAEQQFTGYYHAKQGYSLCDLITSMGLTNEEWEAIKSDYDIGYMPDDDMYEVDDMLNARPQQSFITGLEEHNPPEL